mgnify:CR=1 FL=1|tara:strand:+ start:68 stop:388 length:321 start_codon:yes stop_codon:yes gene_type:complete
MTFLRTIVALALAFGLAAEPAMAYVGGAGVLGATVTGSGPGHREAPTLMAAADCSGAASRAARQTGGQVLSVSTQTQGGQTVCVVTVLVPGKGNQRPRKQTVTIKP